MTSLLPQNASKLERALEVATARLGDVETPLRDLWNPATCPLPLLPWLAWAVSVDVWDDGWPEAVKRSVVASSITLHRRKGPRAAIALSLAPLNLEARIVEWFETVPTGVPGTFKVRVRVTPEAPTVTAALLRQMRQAIDRAKTFSRAYGLVLALDTSGPVTVAGSSRLRVLARISAHPAD